MNIFNWKSFFPAMRAMESQELTGKAEVSVPGLLIVVSAIILCIVVIMIVNGRSKRK